MDAGMLSVVPRKVLGDGGGAGCVCVRVCL